MRRRTVIFKNPHEVELKEEPFPGITSEQVLIQAHFSAISAGSEMLVYHGLVPPELPVDATIPSLNGLFGYPLKYGYSIVGEVIAVGADVQSDWLGRQVFCFHPHESHFAATPEELILLPAGLDPKEALFLPNMETAVGLAMDGCPLIGEQVAIFGQGVVGLLLTAILSQFPLTALISFDKYPLRRKTSLRLGANACFDPQAGNNCERLRQVLDSSDGMGLVDLVYELSGNPQALNEAIEIAGPHARMVIGSWYGQKRALLDLGGHFHRRRLHLISSQVSSIEPALTGRWTKSRRIKVAFKMIKSVHPDRFITHQFKIEEITKAFELIDKHSEKTIQVILSY